MNSFNLAREPWIRVITLQGESKEVSLEQLLHPDLRHAFVLGGEPLEVASAVRLIAGLGFQSRYDNKDVWQMVVDEADSFEMFGDQPFWQDSSLDQVPGQPITYLELDGATGKKLINGTRYGSEDHIMTFAQASRLLVRAQAFTNGTRLRIKSTYPGMARQDSIGHTPASTERLLIHPSSTATVQDILDLMVVNTQNNAGDGFNYSWRDRVAAPRQPRGPADSYSWLNRRIHLRPQGGVVYGVVSASGEIADMSGERGMALWLPDGSSKPDGKSWFRGNSARTALSSLNTAAEAVLSASQSDHSWVHHSNPTDVTVVAMVTETQTPNAVVSDSIRVSQASDITEAFRVSSKVAESTNGTIRVVVSSAMFTANGDSPVKASNSKDVKDAVQSSYSANSEIQGETLEYLNLNTPVGQPLFEHLKGKAAEVVQNRMEQMNQQGVSKLIDKLFHSSMERSHKALFGESKLNGI